MNVVLTPLAPPSFAAFRAAYDDGRGSLVWRKGESSPALKVLKAELAETRKTRKSGR